MRLLYFLYSLFITVLDTNDPVVRRAYYLLLIEYVADGSSRKRKAGLCFFQDYDWRTWCKYGQPVWFKLDEIDRNERSWQVAFYSKGNLSCDRTNFVSNVNRRLFLDECVVMLDNRFPRAKP